MAEQVAGRSRLGPAQSPSSTSESIQALVEKVGLSEPTLIDLNKSLLRVFRQFWSKRIKANPELVEELSNLTVGESIQALLNGRYDASRAQFLTFAYSVSWHVALRHAAFKTRRRELELSVLPPLEVENVTERVNDLEYAETIEGMRSCLEADHEQGLTADERYVIVGLANGKTLAQLAKELSLSLDSIHRRKVRGCEKLRKCLQRKGLS